ncbi:MAG: hypothetical protein A2W99_15420 [Bacteroidetes bacterium GWF2_33_16]|nr:MAG: hypothetical protein A2X00_09630 [Bacteroidetes bacterium GWE2_32_14]OFY07710.1 MAG: hypothetical protein A2W99_15420 [Bacteroidetes bacterium GWF2_33_16]
MKKKLLLLFSLFFLLTPSFSQQKTEPILIERMSWGKDLKIYIELSNDSNYILDIKELPHSQALADSSSNEFTYYPVRLSNDFVDKLKQKEYSSDYDTIDLAQVSHKTLWSALHNSIGGGWIHFVNCLLFALETDNLSITAPLMQRPESNWKPKPMTETYKRTRKWEYYVPIDQNAALKEYKLKKAEKSLGHINDLPPDFINLFLQTSEKEYQKMKESGNRRDVAKIDMIKILLGSNYLGETQIKYIKSMVQKAVTKYAENQLPSVVIFDNFNAAVALILNESGYHIEKIVFAKEKDLSPLEVENRIIIITDIIKKINETNKELFQQKLKNYYN